MALNYAAILDDPDHPQVRDAVERIRLIRGIIHDVDAILAGVDYALWRNDEPRLRICPDGLLKMARTIARLDGTGGTGWPRLSPSEARRLLRRLRLKRRVRRCWFLLHDVVTVFLERTWPGLRRVFWLAHRHLGDPALRDLAPRTRQELDPHIRGYLGLPVPEMCLDLDWPEDRHEALWLLRRVAPLSADAEPVGGWGGPGAAGGETSGASR